MRCIFSAIVLSAASVAVGQDLAGDWTLHRLLIDGEGWQVVAEGHEFTDAPCPDAAGNLYFCDLLGPRTGLYRIGPDGSAVRINHHAVSGAKFAPDGRLIGAQGGAKRIVAIPISVHEGKSAPAAEVLATDVEPNDLAVTPKGFVYFTETAKHRVAMLDLHTRKVRIVDRGIEAPNGIALSPDGGTLAVSDNAGGAAWTFRILSDGSLDGELPWMTLRRPIDPGGISRFNEPPPFSPSGGGDGMCTDRIGRYLISSSLGVQVFDPTGRECGLISKPQPARPLNSCAVAGDFLYITNGDKVYRRRIR